MMQKVLEYKNYLGNLKTYIEESPYKTKFIYGELDMNKQTFYRKLSQLSFSIEEVEKITKLLFPKEALLMELQEAENDIKEGRVYSNEEAMDYLVKKHL